MEKDWSARFEASSWENRHRRAKFQFLVVLLIITSPLSAGWAILGIRGGFQDSMGKPRNSDFRGHVRVYSRALTPLIVPISIAYGLWRMRKAVR